MDKKAGRKLIGVTVIGALLVLSASCASMYHGSLMKGSILEKEDSSVYLCIGKKDGAKVGQELDVYRVKTIMTAAKPPATRMERDLVGKVRITEVIDEHFARAVVVSGSMQKNDIVSLGW
jgi:hypothetical protein